MEEYNSNNSSIIVEDFFNEPNQFLTTKKFLDDITLEKIKLHYDGVAYISLTDNGYTEKLYVISKILKDHKYAAYNFSIKFQPTTLGDLYETFTCKMVAESNNSVSKSHQQDIHQFSNRLTEFTSLLNPNIPIKNRPRFSDLPRQFDVIKQLLDMFRISFDENSSIVLTSLFLHEMEKASIADSFGFCYYQELYNQVDLNDNWFAGIMVQSNFQKPQVFYHNFVN